MNIKELLTKTNIFLDKSFNYKSVDNKNIDILREIIIEHNTLYHKKEDPVISDEEYDKIFLLLQKSEEKLNNYKDTSPTNKLSVALSNQFTKSFHKHPMLSLWNTYNKKDLLDFNTRLKKVLDLDILHKNLDYAIELKFDWLWINLLYNKWKLIKALTRWNWIEWEDVTANILQINNIPREIPYLEEIEIRWEVVLPFSSFKKINKEREKLWKKLFSNPRNAASWSVRLLDYNETKKRNLEFFAYNVPNFENDTIRANYKNNKIKTYSGYIKELNIWWFHTSPYFKVFKNIDLVVQEIDKLNWKKPETNFEVDWLVIKLLDLTKWTKAWMTAHHPRHSIAYKFKAQNVRTRILDIKHSIWRTWIVTPVAILEPVTMDWVVISRATLHNYDELNNKWIKIRDYVFIERAWEVIPEIISVIVSVRDWSEIKVNTPEECPSCWFKLDKKKDKVAIFCANWLNCLAQIQWCFELFVGKTAMNIDWLWKAQVALFLKKWFIKDFADIYDLINFKEEILKLEWYKDKSVNKLLNSIKSRKEIDLDKLLVWLWISWVWKKTAQILSKYITSKLITKNNNYLIKFLENLWENKNNLKLLDLEDIQDIWPETASNIIKYFKINWKLIKKLLSKIKIIFKEEKIQIKNINSDLIWKTFCITWSFDNFKRSELIDLWEQSWLINRTWVTKKLNYLITWSKAWSKKDKADKLWVKIIELKDFLNLIKFCKK